MRLVLFSCFINVIYGIVSGAFGLFKVKKYSQFIPQTPQTPNPDFSQVLIHGQKRGARPMSMSRPPGHDKDWVLAPVQAQRPFSSMSDAA